MRIRSRHIATLIIFALAGSPILACIGAEATHTGGTIYTPIPPYPLSARQNIEQGFGIVHITCDNSGKVAQAVMTRSTGYDDLDENVLNFARAHWHGQPNTRFSVPVDYRLIGSHADTAAGKTPPGEWFTPMPHYPRASVKFLESGSGVVKIATDANGRTIKAYMIKSTGVKRLDDATIDYAIGFWRGPKNNSREVPVRFVLKPPHY